MSLIVAWMKGIMLVAGVLTCTMVYAVIAPQAALQSTFGDTLHGPLPEIVVRNWGALITLVGAMLLWGAFHPPSRPLVLAVAATSKIVYILLVVAQGTRYLSQQANVGIAIDAVMVVLFVAYLVATRSDASHAAARASHERATKP